MRMNKFFFLLYKKLFGCINYHQLLNEYVLHGILENWDPTKTGKPGPETLAGP